jgi:transposase
MRRFGLRDDQWERIKHLLPGREGSVGVTATDNRLFVEAVLYRYRTGMPWRDLPERFGDGVKVHLRFSRWAKSGVWERVFQYLAADADNEYAMIDSTIVRAHQHSAGAQKKLARIKHDLVGADRLLPTMEADMLIADKAFDADARVLEPLAAAGKTAVIPPRANRSSPHDYDRELYAARHLIENFFAKIKQFRAIATRYEKTARNFLAAVQLIASIVWLN